MSITGVTADLPAGQIFYRDSGADGAPVVFLHAASGNSALWEHQMTAVIDAGFRFIALDHRAAARGSNSTALLDGLLSGENGLALSWLLGEPLVYASNPPRTLRAFGLTFCDFAFSVRRL